MSEHDSIIRLMDKNYATIALLFSIRSNDHDEELFGKQFKKKLVDGFEIDYRVPRTNIFNDWLAGSMILHIIETNSLRQLMIDHGADYTAENKKGSTVLHDKVSSKYSSYSKCFAKRSSDEEKLVDIVLSAHIKSGNVQNPKDQNGLTHFHVACMYNHLEGADFFLKNGVPVNETVNNNSIFYPGYSALHFAAMSCEIETAQMLLKSGADMFLEDAKGRNPLHVLLAEKIKMFIRLKRFSRITSIYKNCRNYSDLQDNYHKNQRLITLFLERLDECSTDCLSLINLICSEQNIKITEFINRNEEKIVQLLNTSSQALSGYTPVHFAALFSVEILELLMKNGATLDTKDANGVTPFDMCLKGFNAVDMHKIVLLCPDYSSILFSDGKTMLSDFIHAMQKTETFEVFLEKNLNHANMLVPLDSPVCAGYTPLHLTVICTGQPLNWSWEHREYTLILFDNFQSEQSQKYLSRIDACLRYNPDVTIRDARGSTPLHWAFRFQESYAVRRLLQRLETSSDTSDCVDEYGLSHLHIACADRNVALVEKLLAGGANVNQVATLGYSWLDVDFPQPAYPHKQVNECSMNKGSTPLHFAVSVLYTRNIIEILINYGADVLAKDAKGLTPLEKLLDAPIFDAKKDFKNKLMFSTEGEQSQIAEQLIRKMADKLVDTQPELITHCCSLLGYNDIVPNICKHNDHSLMRLFENYGITALHVACLNRDLLQVQRLVDEIDVNARVCSKSALWPGCTPLHLFTYYRSGDNYAEDAYWTIATTLLERGADVAAKNAEGHTPLHKLFVLKLCVPERNTTERYLKLMLEYLKDFGINPISDHGLTHLHIASAVGAVSVVEKMLQQGAEINQPTDYFFSEFGGFTALHFAAKFQQTEMVNVLLNHGADVNCRSTYDENPLHAASKKYHTPCLGLLRTLFSAGADINARNAYGETPLETLFESEDATREEIEFFLENICRVNTVNPISGQGLLSTALNKNVRLPVFEKMIKAPDVKEIDDSGRSAIHHIVSFRRHPWMTFDDWEIDETYTTVAEYTRVIGSLMKLGLDIDRQDCEGMTPLHVAAKMQNITGIIGLLDHGADINIMDVDGKPAFAYSLKLTELSEEKEDLDRRIFEAISTHIFKLNLARIKISEVNRKIEREIRETDGFEIPKVKECNDEIEKMTKEQIDELSVTLHGFMSDTGAVSAFPHMFPAKREAIDYFFENEIETLRVKFPEFTGILLLQYRKALARCEKMNAALTSLDCLVDFDIPDVCSRITLRYLSNDELNNLIESTTAVSTE